ncbi:MAG: sensor histidine kinase [Pseudoruegeria sp.]
MTLSPEIDGSENRNARSVDVVLGEDWEDPSRRNDAEMTERRARRGLISLNRSALARKIITFNLLALIVLVAGVLYLNPVRNSLVNQREAGLVAESQLAANVFEAQLPVSAPVNLATGDGLDVQGTLNALTLSAGTELYIFDAAGELIGSAQNELKVPTDLNQRSTLISDFLNAIWGGISGLVGPDPIAEGVGGVQGLLPELVPQALDGKQVVRSEGNNADGAVFAVSTPILQNDKPVGAVVLSSAAGEIDNLVRQDREQVLQMFVVALLVSIGLSLALASTIANPLADLAEAAELGRDKGSRKISPSRIRIPDLTARPDEIGRLSGALRGMVTALYDRIDANEQFAADVAHEIKNPLASLRSAVGTLRVAKRVDHREKLLDVIDHDVRRLDRLVSDISNASRLDSELVREEEESFDLLHMLGNINQYLGEQAQSSGIDFISDLPDKPIMVMGLEARLAQVFVNLITNAVSFCEEGDAIRVWARKRENRILIVVEDTGPGIPDQALHKIFNRFYSERPPGQFGNNSGLGLAISKQIVEAHDGVIWAENIRTTDSDVSSGPLGARFVVGLPV